MTANATTPSAPLLDIEPVELPPEFLAYPEEEDHVIAGMGACSACKAEGRKPGCHGYTTGKHNMCGTCGHHYDKHS